MKKIGAKNQTQICLYQNLIYPSHYTTFLLDKPPKYPKCQSDFFLTFHLVMLAWGAMTTDNL